MNHRFVGLHSRFVREREKKKCRSYQMSTDWLQVFTRKNDVAHLIYCADPSILIETDIHALERFVKWFWHIPIQIGPIFMGNVWIQFFNLLDMAKDSSRSCFKQVACDSHDDVKFNVLTELKALHLNCIGFRARMSMAWVLKVFNLNSIWIEAHSWGKNYFLPFLIQSDWFNAETLSRSCTWHHCGGNSCVELNRVEY